MCSPKVIQQLIWIYWTLYFRYYIDSDVVISELPAAKLLVYCLDLLTVRPMATTIELDDPHIDTLLDFVSDHIAMVNSARVDEFNWIISKNNNVHAERVYVLNYAEIRFAFHSVIVEKLVEYDLSVSIIVFTKQRFHKHLTWI